MRRRRRSHGAEPGQSWMLTYSDMITLLLSFFVMLFAFSSLDIQKFEAFLSSFPGSLGVLDGGRSITPAGVLYNGTVPEETPVEAVAPSLDEIYSSVSRLLALEGLEDAVSVSLEEDRGVVVRFSDQVLFDLGRAEIKPEFESTLTEIALALLAWEGEIRVEGHTDSLPINSPIFPSNWELSAARASSVVRFFIEHGLDPARLSIAGYGEYRPIDTNETSEGRAKNRRVDVVLLSPDLMHQGATSVPGKAQE